MWNTIKQIILRWLRKAVIVVITIGLGIFAFMQYREANIQKERAEYFKEQYETCMSVKIPP